MGSEMVELSYTAEVGIRWAYGDQWSCAFLILMDRGLPDDVTRWMEKDMAQDFFPTRKEQDEMVSYTTRTITFEVEVEYTEIDGVKKARGAKLQNTGVPLSVGGYLEVQAMKQVDPSYTSLKEVRK